MAKDETRACLCGILLEINPDKTGMIATDGHRLGSSFINTSIPLESKLSGIISPKLYEFSRILDSKLLMKW